MNLLERARSSLKLRVGRGMVQLRRGFSAGRPARRAAPSERDDVPIIVAGCHRSGTSLFRRILDSHSRIACPPEVQLLEAFGRVVTDDIVERGISSIGVSRDELALDLGALVDRYLRDYAAGRGRVRWAEKSPGTVNQLPAVDALFAGRARFVCIARDGRDVATSLGKGRWTVVGRHLDEHDDPYVAAAHYWVEMNEKLLEFLAAVPERAHLLRYEDLVERPEATLKAVFAFLGEPWEPGVLDFNRVDHDDGWEDHVVRSTWKIEDNRGRYRQLPAPLQARLREVVAPTMRRLGYPDEALG